MAEHPTERERLIAARWTELERSRGPRHVAEDALHDELIYLGVSIFSPSQRVARARVAREAGLCRDDLQMIHDTASRSGMGNPSAAVAASLEDVPTARERVLDCIAALSRISTDEIDDIREGETNRFYGDTRRTGEAVCAHGVAAFDSCPMCDGGRNA